ncbi:hypothetical protein FIBSPDRAFT_895026 [Athelia psychrophila]|uniref:DUF7918 domain-containing protein n=1 Tax=Athelia psychrophila TaxID=1759441 RepID=A0A166F514_9AGAM|nr:hypothetical protein FIBSPDRAFT_895026 [Fibularhizoctonia sp. CBS 109695]
MRIELQGYAAFVVCGDEEVPCYGIERSEDGKSVVCWIASEEGKEFSVKWTKPNHISEAMNGEVQIDDMDCGGRLMREFTALDYVYCREGIRTSAETIKHFVFASLKLTDDDDFLDASALTGLGDIVLSIYRIEITSMGNGWTPKPTPLQRPVHERIKKATAHRVQLGAETPTFERSDKIYYLKRLDNHPMAKFTFKYRPLDVLQANGIVSVPEVKDSSNDIDEPTLEMVQTTETDVLIPEIRKKRKAAVVPKEEAFSDEELEESDVANDDELKALQAEIRTLRSQQIKDLEERVHALQSKPSGSVKRKAAKRVKVERPTAEGFVSGEVIDLTEI